MSFSRTFMALLALAASSAGCRVDAPAPSHPLGLSQPPPEQVYPAPSSSAVLGRGVKTLDAWEPLFLESGICVRGGGREEKTTNLSETFNAHIIETFEQYYSYVDRSLALGAVLPGGGNIAGEIEKSLTERRERAELTIYYAVTLFVPLKSVTFPQYGSERLLDPSKRSLQGNDFFEQCGDKFVSEEIKGGKLLIVFKYDAKDERDYRSTRSKLGASIGSYASLATSTSATSDIISILRKSRVTANAVPSIGVGLDFEWAKQALVGFVDAVNAKNAEPAGAPIIGVRLSNYGDDGAVPFYQSDFYKNQVAEATKFVSNAKDKRDRCQLQLDELASVKAELQSDTQYAWYADDPAALLAHVEGELDAMRACVDYYAEQLAACQRKFPEPTVCKASSEPPRDKAKFPRKRRLAEIPVEKRWRRLGLSSNDSRLGMVACPIGTYMIGWWDTMWSAHVTCAESILTLPWNEKDEKVTDANDCPLGKALTGHHVVNGQIACAPLPEYSVPRVDEQILQNGTDGVECAPGEILTGHNARWQVYGATYKERLVCSNPK